MQNPTEPQSSAVLPEQDVLVRATEFLQRLHNNFASKKPASSDSVGDKIYKTYVYAIDENDGPKYNVQISYTSGRDIPDLGSVEVVDYTHGGYPAERYAQASVEPGDTHIHFSAYPVRNESNGVSEKNTTRAADSALALLNWLGQWQTA